jgi:hypothetical protein
MGDTLVSCTATDDSGNSAFGQFTVTVGDSTAPTVTLLGDNPQTVEVGSGPYVDPGATVSDIADPAPLLFVLNQLPPVDYSAVDTTVVGTYFVPYIAQDESGNTSVEVIREVNVVDTTDPVITVVEPVLNITADSAAGATVDYSTNVSVSDVGDPSVSLVCTPASDTLFVLGTTTVNCTATDASSNEATASFDVSVLLSEGGGVGFGKTNVKAGSVVPLTWSWQDSAGNNVLLPATSQQVTVTNCATGEVVHFEDPGSSGLQLQVDLSWQNNWQTVDNITGEDLPPGDYCVQVDLVDVATGDVIQSQTGGPITIRPGKN